MIEQGNAVRAPWGTMTPNRKGWTFGDDEWTIDHQASEEGATVLRRPYQRLVMVDSFAQLSKVNGNHDHNSPQFTLLPRYGKERAREMAANKWDDAPIGEMRGIARRVKSSVAEFASTFDLTNDVHGVMVDMGAFLSGEPENMLTPVLSERSQRVVRILVEVAALAEVDARDMAIRGCAVAVLCEALGTLGYAVELSMAGTSDTRFGSARTRISVLCPLVKVGEPMDIQSILFAVAHPATFRSFVFNGREQWLGMGNGGSARTVQGTNDMTAEVVRPDVHVGTSTHHVREVANNPEKWIHEMIEEIERGTFK